MWVSGIMYYEYYFKFWCLHDDVIKWKHFPRYWPFVRGIHRSPVNSPHKGQWRGALMFSLICVWINGWVNNREAGDLRRYCAHYDVIVMSGWSVSKWCCRCGDSQSLVRFCDTQLWSIVSEAWDCTCIYDSVWWIKLLKYQHGLGSNILENFMQA